MPEISTSEAVDKLTQVIEQSGPDDLRGFYNEVFPERPKPWPTSIDEGSEDKRAILEHFRSGLAIDEILDLWHVAFPGSRNVYYNEIINMIHYQNRRRALRSSD